MNAFRYIPVVLLLVGAIVLSTRKGDMPLALRGIRKMLGKPTVRPAVQRVSVWRRLVAFFLTLLAFVLCVVAQETAPVPAPEAVFKNPPPEAHAGVWWHWMGGQVTRAGIVKDLDWFARMGITSATIFGMADSCTPWAKRIANIPTGNLHPYSPRWWALVRFACAEGKKRNIDIGLHNCPGYTSTGGKWIPPHLAMRQLVFNVRDPARDISTRPNAQFPVYNEDKGVFEKPDCLARCTNYVPIATVHGISIGHIPMGSFIQPADWDSFGLECDKMNPQAVNFHLDQVIAAWKKHLGPNLPAAGLRHVLLDSYEAGTPSWTPDMPAAFKARRGYDCLPYLPILGGFTNFYTVAECTRFKRDFDRTIRDLYRDVLFKIMSERLHAEGLVFVCEPYEGPFETAEVVPFIDRVMSEFWYNPNKPSSPMAVSCMKVPVIEAEAFTGHPSKCGWTETPASLKPSGDAAWQAGVSRFILHTTPLQPWDDSIRPGVTMGRWGTHFGRTQTWAETGRAWFDYVARAQALLQWSRKYGTRRVLFVVNEAEVYHALQVTGCGHWFDAVTGRILAQPPSALAPHESGFWVSDASTQEATDFTATLLGELPDPKCLSEAQCVCQVLTDFAPALGDWTHDPDPAIRYFSGTRVYRTKFALSDSLRVACTHQEDVSLDLGKVAAATVRVRVNGQDCGIVWCAPWSVTIPFAALKARDNLLEIELTNVWRNRLIGDEQEPEDVTFVPAPLTGETMMLAYPDWFAKGLSARPSKGRKCFTTWKYVSASSPLAPSGLLGPVQLRATPAEQTRTQDVKFINPMIGAITLGGYGGHGLGKTFPGVATPFGMVQLSPDTVTGGDNGCGYSYHHKTIEGFSFLHMSGVGWYGEFGNFQVMPTTGPRCFDREKACSPFSHSNEIARAGYYGVQLDRYGILAELTVAPHAGLLRFTYPQGTAPRIQIDLARRIGQKARWLSSSEQTLRVVDDHTVEGRMICVPADGGWGRGCGGVSYRVHFYAVFSQSFVRFGVWDREHVFEGLRDYTGTNTGFFAEFPASTAGQQIALRAGISFVDVAGAQANLNADIPTFEFERVCQAASARWGEALSGISVTGGTAREREIFATALYHSFIDPRAIADVDGRYRTAKGTIAQSRAFTQRTVFSGWDVFRSAFPLYTLVRPDVVSDTINSMLETVRCGARASLPRWDIFGCPGGCMIGHPLIPVMADAWEKGIRTFDGKYALQESVRTITAAGGGNTPRGWYPNSLSVTLEYAYDDWCVARLAQMQGREDLAKVHFARAKAYTNCWDASVGWMRARQADGSWLAWQGRKTHGQGCTESNPYQQGWFVPHDPEGLIVLMGGRARFTQELEAFFGGTPDDFLWNDCYNHPNEPCHFVPYLFAFSDKPYLTQQWTRRILDKAYGTGVRGLCGNDDCGQMSAWYVLSAIGLHPNCPGDGKWYLTAPLFKACTIRLDPKYYAGKTFTIRAPLADATHDRINAVRLNGRPLNRLWISTQEVSQGGILDIDLGS